MAGQMFSSTLTKLFLGSSSPTLLATESSLGLSSVIARNASKKATGGKRNPKSSRGQGRKLELTDGKRARKTDLIARQIKPNWLPGLNVHMGKDLTLTALKEGRIVISCENPNLDMSHEINQKFYTGREEVKFFKKYIHVIPDPQHVRFKLLAQV